MLFLALLTVVAVEVEVGAEVKVGEQHLRARQWR